MKKESNKNDEVEIRRVTPVDYENFVHKTYTDDSDNKESSDLPEEISKPKGTTYVKLNSTGQTLIVDRDNGTGQDIYLTQSEHMNILNEKQKKPSKMNYDFELPNYNNAGRKVKFFEDDSTSRNTASDKEFKRVDPCNQRNIQEEEFFHNINNIK